jgi:hypothetical protein
MPVPIGQQITCIQREIALRQRLYPRWVAEGRMTQVDANGQIARMQAVLDTLKRVRDGEDLFGRVAQ